MQKHIARRSLISLPQGNIANLARDLYRCVLSLTENTLRIAALFDLAHKLGELLALLFTVVIERVAEGDDEADGHG